MYPLKEWLVEALYPLPSDVISFLTKIIAFIFYVSIGLLAMVGDRLRKGKPIKDWKFFGSILLAIAIGSLSCSYSMNNFPDKAQYIVPISTLFSEKIFILLSEWVEKKFKNTVDKEENL